MLRQLWWEDLEPIWLCSADDDDDGGGGGGGGDDDGGDDGGDDAGTDGTGGSGQTGDDSNADNSGDKATFGGDAKDTAHYDGGGGGGTTSAAADDSNADSNANDQASMDQAGQDNASLGLGQDTTDKAPAAGSETAASAAAGLESGVGDRFGRSLGGNEGGTGDISTALTGDPNVAAALGDAGQTQLAALEQNPSPAPPSMDPNVLTPGQFDPSLLPNQPNGPPATTNPYDFFDPSFTPPNQQPSQPDGTPTPPPAPVGPQSQAANLGWADTIGNALQNSLGIGTANAAPQNFTGNFFGPGENIMPEGAGPQTVDSTVPGALDTTPVGLGGPFQAGPGNTMTGNQAVSQAAAAGEFSNGLPSWTDTTSLSPSVNSPANSVAAGINEGLAVGGLPASGTMTTTASPLSGGLVGPGDPGMLSGTPMADQAPVDFNQTTPATGINPNDPNQTVVAKTQPSTSQVATSTFQDQANTLAPWAFAGDPSAPAPAPVPDKSSPPAPDTVVGGPTPDTSTPTPSPTTQSQTAPTDPGAITNQPDVTQALAGGSTLPQQPPLSAASLAAPIPSGPTLGPIQPDSQPAGPDGGPVIPNFPMESDGPNFNPESGLFGYPGLPGGPVPQNLAGGVQGPILGPVMDPNGAGIPPDPSNLNPNEGLFQAINNAIDTADGANINPNQGIT